jgi:hypothetical protein
LEELILPFAGVLFGCPIFKGRIKARELVLQVGFGCGQLPNVVGWIFLFTDFFD